MKQNDIRKLAHEVLDNFFDYVDAEDARITGIYDELIALINKYGLEEENEDGREQEIESN